MSSGVVCNFRESLDAGRRPLQDITLHSDCDVGQYDLYTHRHERRPLPRHLSASESRVDSRPDLEAESNDIHRMDWRFRLRFASAIHLQTGVCCRCGTADSCEYLHLLFTEDSR